MNHLSSEMSIHLSDRHLNLILLPTEKCNFRCTYCYESFDVGRMEDSVVSGVKALISNRIPELDSILISWFGGEPMLGMDVIEKISAHIQEEIASLNPDCFYKSNITTNGFLLSKNQASKLLKLGVKEYQISLDGDEAEHNKTRIRANGKGTYSDIVRNLLGMSEFDDHFDVIIRVHFHPANLSSIEGLLSSLPEKIKGDSRFHFYFKAIHHLGGKNDHEFDVVGYKSEDEISDSLKELAISYGINNFNLKKESYVCYASAANSFVVRPNGSLGKCTVALYDDKNSVGEITAEGQLLLNNEKIRPWLTGLVTGNEKIRACPMPYVKSL